MSPADLRATPEFNETDGRLTRAEALHELRAIGYTDYDIVKMDGRGVTELDALGAYIQSLGPNRMYEPGGRVSMVEGQTLPADTRYALDGHPGDSDPQPAAAPGNDDRPDDAAHAMLVQNREPRGLPEGVDPPPDWAGLAEMHATYWAPNEYEDLVTIAKEENKIPAFEARFITNGRGIYLGKCAHCHGLNGQGNGPAGRYMMKKPANFWLPQFKLYDDAMWFYRIVEGVPGTEMPVWKYSLKQRKHSAQWDQVWYLVTYLKYVAANSPMEQVPYDLPPEYYMTDQERSRKAIFPVDPAVVNQLKAQAEAKSEAQDTATEGYEGPPVTAPEPREREDARSAAPQDVEGER